MLIFDPLRIYTQFNVGGRFLCYDYSLCTGQKWDTFEYPMEEDHLGYKYRFKAFVECMHERIYIHGKQDILNVHTD